ncbi:PA2169 family four-helix-bundle protein [Gallaecimonas xiamenensis]|uniref:DUF2383 domain-containing protein n=1 Tax=Gallaecimonas xiamenensis 3-C-1 TaxID=745411 RepID=K2K6R6_9GAMM|nr:PA2169 family four-helix-bundle protein [Gallaecimonas xiamenensis]EKE73090.1 hypothetical protein B3C1_10752 [Gallaecimonas xiamenensis 3-C-1]
MFATPDARLVQDLLSLCRDGRLFYQEAARAVDDSELQSLFREMAAVRAQVAKALSLKVVAGTQAPPGNQAARMQALYLRLASHLGQDRDFRYVAQLEEAEDSVLARLRDGVQALHSKPLAQDLADCLADIQLTHDRMKAIKDGLLAPKH